MTKAEDDSTKPPLTGWQSLRKVFGEAGHSPAAIATAIEAEGIYRIDHFGRRQQVKKNSDEMAEAFSLVASLHEYLTVPDDFDSPQHAWDFFHASPDDPFGVFGWPAGSLPTFADEPASGAPQRPASTSGDTKKRDSLLIIIAGLLHHVRVGPNESRATGMVVRWIDLAGLKLSEDTIRNVLKEIPAAKERRKKEPD